MQGAAWMETVTAEHANKTLARGETRGKTSTEDNEISANRRLSVRQIASNQSCPPATLYLTRSRRQAALMGFLVERVRIGRNRPDSAV